MIVLMISESMNLDHNFIFLLSFVFFYREEIRVWRSRFDIDERKKKLIPKSCYEGFDTLISTWLDRCKLEMGWITYVYA